jgi:hypothetical protein
MSTEPDKPEREPPPLPDYHCAPRRFSYPKPDKFTEEKIAHCSRFDEHIKEVLSRQKKRGRRRR